MLNRNVKNLHIDLTEIKEQNKIPAINILALEKEQEDRLNQFLKIKNAIKEIKPEDLTFLAEIGFGTGGCVNKMSHKWTSQVMATKIIPVDLRNTQLSTKLRELEVLHDCKSPYIVGFYGVFYTELSLHICMEFMDVGSLDCLMKTTGRFPEPIIAKIAFSVVCGLAYLRTNHRIIHRDIKPSNILINTNGEVKLCDFGISGYLVDSMANSFVGTKSYMAPERLLGASYSVQSDIWSLGLSLMELAVGYHPIPCRKVINDENSFGRTVSEHWAAAKRGILLGEIWESTTEEYDMSLFDILEYINSETPPQLPDIGFTMEFRDLVDSCLKRDPDHRVHLENLKGNPYLNTPELARLDLSLWVCKVTSNPKVFV